MTPQGLIDLFLLNMSLVPILAFKLIVSQVDIFLSLYSDEFVISYMPEYKYMFNNYWNMSKRYQLMWIIYIII